MIADDALEILASRSRDELRRELIKFANRLGFETVSAFIRIDAVDGTWLFDGVDNTPAGYLPEFRDSTSGRRDPVMQHCKRESTPLAWDQATYVENDAGPKYERQAAFGYRSGIAMAMHLPGGRHFFLGVDRNGSLPSDSSEKARLVAAVAVYTLYAQTAASRTLFPRADDGAEHMSLTPRRARGAALDPGRQDGMGRRDDSRHRRADRRDPREPGHAQAGVCQQTSSGAQGVATRDDLNSFGGSSRQPTVVVALRALASCDAFDAVPPSCGLSLNATKVAIAAAAKAPMPIRSQTGPLAVSTRRSLSVSGSVVAGTGRSLAERGVSDRIVPSPS